MTFIRSVWRATTGLILVVSSSGATFGDDSLPEATRSYARVIAAALSDLDAGRSMEARKKLVSTEKLQRGFEYEYLMARAKDAPGQGLAPDLIQSVAAPQVEFRYAVLNEATNQAVFICRDGAVRVYDLGAPAVAPKVLPHEGGGAIWSGAFSSDGRVFVAGYENGQVLVWETETWKQRAEILVGKKLPVRELAVAPDGSSFAAEGDSAIELWSLGDGGPKKLAELGPRYNFGEGLAFSPKGDLVATGGMFDIEVYSARTGEKAKTIRHASYTMGLAFSPDGSRIASAPSGNVNKVLAVFQVAQGAAIFHAGPFPCYIHGGVFTSDGKRIVSTACEQVPSLNLYDSATGELVFSLPRPRHGSRPAMSQDGHRLGWTEKDAFRFVDLGRTPTAGN